MLHHAINFIFLFLVFTANAQQLLLQPAFQQKNLELNRRYSLNDSVEFELSMFKLYGCFFSGGSKSPQPTPADYQLFDLSNAQAFTVQQYDAKQPLYFQLGVDSATSSSGIYEGALDPIHGMYWTWHSGYVFLKIEGNFWVNQQQKTIQLHIGGYQYPHKAITMAQVQEHTGIVKLELEYFFNQLAVANRTQIMTPSTAAVEVANWWLQSVNTKKL